MSINFDVFNMFSFQIKPMIKIGIQTVKIKKINSFFKKDKNIIFRFRHKITLIK